MTDGQPRIRYGRFSVAKAAIRAINNGLMKTLLTLTVTAIAMASFATSTFAGSCGSCPGEGGEKSKDKSKTEESTQS